MIVGYWVIVTVNCFVEIVVYFAITQNVEQNPRIEHLLEDGNILPDLGFPRLF